MVFHVCKNVAGFDPVWELVNGSMVPQAHIGNGVLLTDLAPRALAIWITQVNGIIYQWQISIDTTDPDTPYGQYVFTDKTGDIYTLSAYTPMVHTVAFNSTDPTIIKVQISPTYGAPGDWANAPVCSS